MTAYVQIRHFKPEVDIRIIHLTLRLRGILFLSGSGDDNKLFRKPAGRMAMPGVLHGVSLDELELVVDLDLIE